MQILDGHRQNKYHSRQKTTNILPRSFFVNIYRKLSLSIEFINGKKVLCGKPPYSVILYFQFESFVYELSYQGRTQKKKI